MQYLTHLAASLAVTLPVMAATNTATPGAVVALSLGALLPDIDEPNSWIGRRTGPISWALNRLFGHRGMTHSLIGWGAASLLAALVIRLALGLQIWTVYFSLGYLFHLVEDSFSKSGVPWLLPWSKRLYQSGWGVVYYITGRGVEHALLLVFILAVLMEYGYFFG